MSTIPEVDQAESPTPFDLEATPSFSKDGNSTNNQTGVCVSRKHLLLQPQIFGALAVSFALLAVALEAMYITSERRQGLLTTTYSDNHFAWTYGPAVLIATLSAVWTCIDFTAKTSSPWLHGGGGRTNGESLLLDYISMFSLLVPYKAARNRNFLVATTSTVSLLLCIMLVFAPSLLSLATLDTVTSVTILNDFMDNPSNLANPGLLPLYGAIGLKRYHMDYPFGIQDNIVFQSFSPRPGKTTEINTTAEALEFDLQCDLANVTGFSTDRYYGEPKMSFKIGSPGCDHASSSEPFSFVHQSPPLKWDPSQNKTVEDTSANKTLFIGNILRGNCHGNASDLDDRRLLWIFADFFIQFSRATFADGLQRSVALMCKPLYKEIEVDIEQSGGGAYHLSKARDVKERKLKALRAWDITEAMLDTYQGVEPVLFYDDLHSSFYDDNANLDKPSLAILSLDNSTYPDIQSVFTSSSLSESVRKYYQIHSTFIVQNCMRDSLRSAPGTARTPQTRLFVQTPACHIMASICLVSALTLTVAFFTIQTNNFSLPEDPRTVLGIAILRNRFAESFPRLFGAANTPELETAVLKWRLGHMDRPNRSDYPEPPISGNSLVAGSTSLVSSSLGPAQKINHSPVLLRKYSRALLCLVICSILALLEVLLQTSKRNTGLGKSSQPGSYLHYLWTLMPSVAMGLLAIGCSAVDLEQRILAPFSALSQGPVPLRCSLQSNLCGILLPHDLYREFRGRDYACLSTTLAAGFAGLLTISSGSMFFTRNIYSPSDQSLRVIGSFSTVMYQNDYHLAYGTEQFDPGSGAIVHYGVSSSLILQNNLSYPIYTFEDLAFPSVLLEKPNTSSLNGGLSKVNAILPALKGGLSCEIMTDSITFDVRTPFPTIDGNAREIRLNITDCLPVFFSFEPSQISQGVFASASSLNCDSGRSVLDYFYIWGSFTTNTTQLQDGEVSVDVLVSGALGCNAFIEAVDVNTAFYTTSSGLGIRPDDPPIVLEGTSQSVIGPNNRTQRLDGVYHNLATPIPDKANLIDAFFTTLTNSQRQHAVPVSMLSDHTQSAGVIESIKKQHGIIVAQALSATSRATLDEGPGVFERVGKGRIGSTIPATVVDLSKPEPRVFQDEKSTRILQALLAGTFAFSLLGWLLSPRCDILPRPPTSPASVMAMLVDGNLYTERFGPNKKTVIDMDPEEIDEMFGDDKPAFWMGWGRDGSDFPRQKGRERKDVAEKEEMGKELAPRRFGIWVVPELK